MFGFFKRNIFRAVLFIAAFLAGYFGYLNFFPRQRFLPVEYAKVQKGILNENLTISGSIEAAEHVTLRFQTSGRLSWVGVKEGDKVKKFQGIASLDTKEIQLKIQKYLNTYLKERNSFDQTTKDDYKDKVLTDAIKRTLEDSQLDLDNSVLDVQVQDLAKQYSLLWTPIEGIVIRADTPSAGVNITAATAEFEVVNPNTVYFEALADQNEVVNLTEGMSGSLTLDSYPEKVFPGIIENISFTPKEGESGTVYAVKFGFNPDNVNYGYKIGMTGDLSFVTDRIEGALYIPSKFIKRENGNTYVNVMKDGKIIKKPVSTGDEYGDNTLIKEGLNEGEAVYN